MNPMNRREALRESLLDEQEGADALMVSGAPTVDAPGDNPIPLPFRK